MEGPGGNHPIAQAQDSANLLSLVLYKRHMSIVSQRLFWANLISSLSFFSYFSPMQVHIDAFSRAFYFLLISNLIFKEILSTPLLTLFMIFFIFKLSSCPYAKFGGDKFQFRIILFQLVYEWTNKATPEQSKFQRQHNLSIIASLLVCVCVYIYIYMRVWNLLLLIITYYMEFFLKAEV